MPATKSEISEFRENIIELHNKIIDRSGGERGIRDEGGLDHGIYMLISYFDTHKDKPVEIAARFLISLQRGIILWMETKEQPTSLQKRFC